MNKLLCTFILLLVQPVYASQTNELADAAVAKRIQPIGSVYIQDDLELADLPGQHRVAQTSHHAAPEHSSGQEVYNNYCYICHQEGVAGAPIFGHPQAWQSRADKGLNLLVKHVLEGYRYMPPLGTCLECSDAEIKAAVNYILQNSIKTK